MKSETRNPKPETRPNSQIQRLDLHNRPRARSSSHFGFLCCFASCFLNRTQFVCGFLPWNTLNTRKERRPSCSGVCEFHGYLSRFDSGRARPGRRLQNATVVAASRQSAAVFGRERHVSGALPRRRYGVLKSPLGFRVSGFGFLSGFGFRISDFCRHA